MQNPGLNFYYYFFSSSKYPFCTAINWMWTFQPLVPNIHLPTDEDAQEDIRASIFCLLYSLWSQWEKNFYSKPNNFPFLWRLLCLVWFSSCLSPLTASLLLMEMQKQPLGKERKKKIDIYMKIHHFHC